MITPYQRLAKRIRNEISDMELVLQRMLKAWRKSMENSDAQELYLDSVALNLHAYTINLIPEKMCKLVSSVGELWSKLNTELLAFAEFLDEIAGE